MGEGQVTIGLTIHKYSRNRFATELFFDVALSSLMSWRFFFCLFVCVLVSAITLLSRASMIWDGPMIGYNQPAPVSNQASNQDRITPDVWLTRTNSKGLFNAFNEKSAGNISPSNTLWAFGNITNYSTLMYTNWLALLNRNSPVTLIGQPMVVYLTPDDIYFSILITNWPSGGAGGFGYLRSTPVVSYSGTTVSNGQFSFNYSTETNFAYDIISSTNLVDWVSVSTNMASSSSTMYSTAANPEAMKFYQVNLLPQQ